MRNKLLVILILPLLDHSGRALQRSLTKADSRVMATMAPNDTGGCSVGQEAAFVSFWFWCYYQNINCSLTLR